MNQKLIFTDAAGRAIDDLVAKIEPTDVFVLVDVNTSQYVLPLLIEESEVVKQAKVITIKAGDVNKNLDSLKDVWKSLHELGASRHSVLINIGGGVVTDLGGFAASTFMRGLKYINVPTTLLSAVDASVGGKTGINFNGVKNEIGCFSEPEASVITTVFFNTLPEQELLSGYAEMLKHGLLDSDQTLNQLLGYSVVYPEFDRLKLATLLEDNIKVKERIVEQDFRESGIRKALNLGHTVGHAFESMALRRQSPIPHGYAVAYGTVVALILSHLKLGFPSAVLSKVAKYVLTNYRAFYITCDDYDDLLQIMSYDKKNLKHGETRFTLLAQVGQPKVDVVCSPDEIKTALDIYRDMMGI